MLRTTTIGKVISRTVRKRGWDPAVWTGTTADYDLFEDAINDAVRKAYSFQKWPELMRIEERQYMPDWAIGTAYVADNYVYHEEAYWKCLKSDTGTEPGTDDTVWSADVSDMPKFIQLAQPWETYIIDEDGVDLQDFAFRTDPRLTPNIRSMTGCDWWMDAITLPYEAENTVWIKFMPQAPKFTFLAWDDETVYAKGDVCYIAATGMCWQALDASTNVTPGTDETKWIEMGVPEFLAEYLSEVLLGEWITEQEGKYEKLGRAQQILNELAERKYERRGTQANGRISMMR
jgi:hypothetical protein